MSEQTNDTPTTPPAPKTATQRRFGAGALVAMLLVGAGGGGAAVHFLLHRDHAGHDDGGAAAAAKPGKQQFQCPMHPTVVMDHQGDCPICGMKLVPMEMPGASATAAAAAKPKSAKQQYQCPMHPTIVMDHQGDCPICGMKLVPMDGGSAGSSGSGERKVAFYRSPHNPNETSKEPKKDAMGMDYVPVYEDELSGGGAQVKGLAEVTIDPQRQQLIGLRTAEVTRGAVGGNWRTVGRVAVDETRVKHVNVKVSGFVEDVFVDFTGKSVRKGAPLFTIYSPEVVSAQNEYLLARGAQGALAKSGMMKGSADELVSSARQRLKYWDIPDSTLAELDRTGKARRTITLVSPIAGVVTKKDIVAGARIEEGSMPYEITDLSTVWVLADVYESELGKVKDGMRAELTLQAFPNRTFKGKVLFLDPLLGKDTRTAKVRLEFPNPKGELRPEMFGEVVLKAGEREGLRIPADAVVRSGTQDVVFVATGSGKFEPREIQLGATGNDAVEVVRGLEAGEKVVTRANFLVDSESRLRASLAAMRGE